MKNWFTIMLLHMYGSLTLNQLQLIMHTHDFRLNHRIRVLRVHQKINHLRAKINEIKGHHHVPRPKPSEIDSLIDQNNTVLKNFENQLGLCSWRFFGSENSNCCLKIY